VRRRVGHDRAAIGRRCDEGIHADDGSVREKDATAVELLEPETGISAGHVIDPDEARTTRADEREEQGDSPA
jgi:hypothetical protein